jgi:Family of unknown function (DUF6335)
MARKARKQPTARRAASRLKRRASPATNRRSAGAARKAGRKTSRKKRTAAKPTRVAKGRAKTVKKTARRAAPPKRAAARRAPSRAGASAKPVRTTTKAAAKPTASAKPAAKGARSTARAAAPRPLHTLSLDRNRRHLPELEDNIPTPPSSLDLDRTPSAARSGRHGMREARMHRNETSPELTGGDVDASWEDAYSTGDEAPGGDNPTPDQDRVDDIGKALGVQYEDSEELKAADKITERDRHRWELDPASAEDYPEHDE